MAYATFDEVKKILKTNFMQYPDDITYELEYAEAEVHSYLSGHYPLRFDDATKYSEVPVQIKWITSLLVGWRLFDTVTVLEGQTDAIAGKRWHKDGINWLKALASGSARLTMEDGTLIESESSLPRSYPSGTRDKASSENNDPWFTRAQAGQW